MWSRSPRSAGFTIITSDKLPDDPSYTNYRLQLGPIRKLLSNSTIASRLSNGKIPR